MIEIVTKEVILQSLLSVQVRLDLRSLVKYSGRRGTCMLAFCTCLVSSVHRSLMNYKFNKGSIVASVPNSTKVCVQTVDGRTKVLTREVFLP